MEAAETAVAAALAPLRGRTPDLALAFVSGEDPGHVGRHALALTGAKATLGCTADGVMGAGDAVFGPSAVSVWVGVLPGATLRTFHLEVMPSDSAAAVIGLPPGPAEAAILLADGYTFPVEGFLDSAAASFPGLPFVGGVASGARGDVRLWVDGRTVDRGAVGVLLSGTDARPVLSQGCRPIGPAMTITAASGNRILELAGLPALERLKRVLDALPPPEQAIASSGLSVGIAADEYAEDHDFLVRALISADATGLVVGDRVSVGQTVRLQVRDADAAAVTLKDAIARCPGQPGSGALLFSCNGRGEDLFGTVYGGAAHDVRAVQSGLAADAVAGFFAAGEIGPVAGRSHLHGFTASVLVLP